MGLPGRERLSGGGESTRPTEELSMPEASECGHGWVGRQATRGWRHLGTSVYTRDKAGYAIIAFLKYTNHETGGRK